METIYIDFEAERAEHQAHQKELHARGLPALERLFEVAEGDTHQPHHCRRILLAVYNGASWPLDLTCLRVLDRDLQEAALTVIEWAAYTDRELYEYVPEGSRRMQRFWDIEKATDQD